mgnify:CR=1 FL=1
MCKLVHKNVTARTCIRHKNPHIGRVIHMLRCLDKLTNLQHGRPHRALTASHRARCCAVVEELVRNDSATQSQEPHAQSANINSM